MTWFFAKNRTGDFVCSFLFKHVWNLSKSRLGYFFLFFFEWVHTGKAQQAPEDEGERYDPQVGLSKFGG